MAIVHVDDRNFDMEVLKSDIPVIVDFWAEWCMPCKMFGPIFEETSEDYKGKVKFVKASTEEAPEAAQKYSIMSIPSILFFKDGEEVRREMGMMAKDRLKEAVDKML